MGSTLIVDEIQGATASTKVKMPAGSVLQTLYYQKTGNQVITATSYTDILTNCNITPHFATSKIYIIASIFATHNDNHSGLIRILRGSTPIGGHPTATSQRANFDNNVWFNIRYPNDYSAHQYSCQFLDSPATTNQISYKMVGLTTGDADGLRINRTQQNADLQYDSPGTTMITLQEIAQ